MLGEIIHYNEERAYGFIEVENDTNHYFFHISNLIDNKNTKINIKQKVKFESVYTDKGFTAKDIQFIKQVECPICKTLNYETNKNCTKINCKWDLTYAKDCSYIGLSSEEINKYNINGETKTRKEWCLQFNLNPKLVGSRMSQKHLDFKSVLDSYGIDTSNMTVLPLT